MSPTELGVLTELAAVRYLLSEAGQEDLLETLGAQDRARSRPGQAFAEDTRGQLDELLKRGLHPPRRVLRADLRRRRQPPRETLAENLEHIAALLMDRRYPQHPTSSPSRRRPDLEALLDWMVQAGETNVSVAYDENVGKVLKTSGSRSSSSTSARPRRRCASTPATSRTSSSAPTRTPWPWTPIADHLRETYGFQPLVDLFLCFLCQRDHRALAGDRAASRSTCASACRRRRASVCSAASW
jgi:hypothetical protein